MGLTLYSPLTNTPYLDKCLLNNYLLLFSLISFQLFKRRSIKKFIIYHHIKPTVNMNRLLEELFSIRSEFFVPEIKFWMLAYFQN